jgi:hypothetical protein
MEHPTGKHGRRPDRYRAFIFSPISKAAGETRKEILCGLKKHLLF